MIGESVQRSYQDSSLWCDHGILEIALDRIECGANGLCRIELGSRHSRQSGCLAGDLQNRDKQQGKNSHGHQKLKNCESMVSSFHGSGNKQDTGR